MLQQTFVFLKGIGLARERKLWQSGIDSWQVYRRTSRISGVKPALKTDHDAVLAAAQRRLGTDPAFFAHLLPSEEHWRAYDEFASRAVYFDIETTGDRTNTVTVVGMRKAGESRVFVKPRVGSPDVYDDIGAEPYTPDAVSDFVADGTCLVTFNGASFDEPVLKAEGVRFPAVPHVDLLPVFHRSGMKGGLKKIETELGMNRGGVAGLTGYDAVKLWRRYWRKGDVEALATLVEYNREDFINLEPLAGYGVDRLKRFMWREAQGQTRLPIEDQSSPDNQ